jgi:hypothetical protein
VEEKRGWTAKDASPIPARLKMHFVAALDRVPSMRPVLALFEGW